MDSFFKVLFEEIHTLLASLGGLLLLFSGVSYLGFGEPEAGGTLLVFGMLFGYLAFELWPQRPPKP
ncbi:MAG: hypothetical protein KDD44_03875 [Bdellovibrionales bacterium]|nr:hypothetical protein [Bdellovibrionales bacterium]